MEADPRKERDNIASFCEVQLLDFLFLDKQRLTFRKSSLQENRKCRYILYVDLVVLTILQVLTKNKISK